MAGNIATVGFVAETDSLVTAKKRMEDLPPAAAKVETAAKKFGAIDWSKNLNTSGVTKLKSEMEQLVPVVTKVGTASAKTAEDMTKTGGAASKLAGFFTSLKGAVILAGAALAALGFAQLIGVFKEMAAAIGDTADAAKKLGASVESMQNLRYAAEKAGISLSQFVSVNQKVNNTLQELDKKGKGSKGVFDVLGKSASELLAMPLSERLQYIGDKMKSLQLTSDETGLVLKKLGDSSGSLAVLLGEGGDAIRKAAADMEYFNVTLNADQVQGITDMNDAFSNLSLSIQGIGNQILAAVAPAIAFLVNGLAEGIRFIGELFGGLVSLIGRILSPIVRIIIAPFKLAFDGITAIYNAFDADFKAAFGINFGAAVKIGLNAIYNSFSATFQAIGIIWDALPSILGSAAIAAVNLVIKSLNYMVNASIMGINTLINSIPEWMRGGKEGLTLPEGGDWAVKLDDPFAGDTKAAFDGAAAAFKAQMNVDNFAGSADKAGAASTNAAGGVKGLGDALDKTGGAAAKSLTELEKIGKELDKMGAPFDQAKSAFDKLTELQKNGIITGDQYAAMLGRIQTAFLAAGGTAEQWSKIISKSTIDMSAALKEFSTNSLTSIGDTLADLAVDGKADFKALADGIIKDLIRIMWQTLIVKPLIAAVFPGFADGGTFGTASKFANGGTFGSVKAFANGSAFTNNVYNRPTPFTFANGAGFSQGVMGEAGPEAVMPLKRGMDGALGVQMHGGGVRGGNANVFSMGDINIDYVGNGNQEDDEKSAVHMADIMEQRIRQIADEQFSKNTQYGGAANPRGIYN